MSEPANIKTKDQYVYFLYSEQQLKNRTEVEKKMGRTFSPGTVIVNGKKQNYTELSKRNTNSRYPDCKIVAEGWLSRMTYTKILQV